MGDLSDFQVGQTVELQDGRIAKIHFAGETHFAGGYWLGVELDDASGKNDGAVQGQRYFSCKPAHGMFIRPSVATVLEQPKPKQNGPSNGRADGPPAKARPTSIAVAGLRRQSTVDMGASKRQSINSGSPTPAGRAVQRLGVSEPVDKEDRAIADAEVLSHQASHQQSRCQINHQQAVAPVILFQPRCHEISPQRPGHTGPPWLLPPLCPSIHGLHGNLQQVR